MTIFFFYRLWALYLTNSFNFLLNLAKLGSLVAHLHLRYATWYKRWTRAFDGGRYSQGTYLLLVKDWLHRIISFIRCMLTTFKQFDSWINRKNLNSIIKTFCGWSKLTKTCLEYICTITIWYVIIIPIHTYIQWYHNTNYIIPYKLPYAI